MEWIARLLGSPTTDAGTVFANLVTVLGRLIGSDAILVLIGGSIFLAFVRIPYSTTRKGRWLDELAHQWLWGTWAAALGGAITVFALRGPATRGVPFGDMLADDALLETLDSRFGLSYIARIMLLLGVVPLLLMGWPWVGGKGRLAARRRPGWLLAAALILTAPVSGHSGAGAWPGFGVLVGFTHFASATIWGGGLLLLFAAYLPRSDTRLREYLPLFSKIAMIAFVVAAFSGTVQAWRQLGSTGVFTSLDNLTSTTYGWLTLGKLLAFAVLVAVAAGSRNLSESVAAERSGAPAQGRQGRRRGGVAVAANPNTETRNNARIRHLIKVEFVVAFFVFLFTAMMTNVAPSYEEVAGQSGEAVAQQPAGQGSPQAQDPQAQEQQAAAGQEGQQGQGGQQGGDAAQQQAQGEQPPAAPASTATINATGFAWQPTELQLAAGTAVTVTVANADGALHSFTLDEAGVDQDVQGGQTAAVEFTTPAPGEYVFYCQYHTVMTGTLTVA